MPAVKSVSQLYSELLTPTLIVKADRHYLNVSTILTG